MQTVVDEGALRHDQILSGVRAASGRNGFLWSVEIIISRHSIISVRVTGYDRARIRRKVVLRWRGEDRSAAPQALEQEALGRIEAPASVFAAVHTSASLIGHSGSSAFRLSTTAVSMSLAGSRFSPDSAPRPFHHGFRRRGGTIFRASLPSM